MSIFTILNKKWAIDILRFINNTSKSYSEIEKLVSNPRTTSSRLRDFEEKRILIRQVQQDKHRSVKYSLTTLGLEILKKINEIENLIKKDSNVR